MRRPRIGRPREPWPAAPGLSNGWRPAHESAGIDAAAPARGRVAAVEVRPGEPDGSAGGGTAQRSAPKDAGDRAVPAGPRPEETRLERLERACAAAAEGVACAEAGAARARVAAARCDEQLAAAVGRRAAAASALAEAEAALRALDADSARRAAREHFDTVAAGAAGAEAVRAAGDRWVDEIGTLAAASSTAAVALEVAAAAADVAGAVESRAVAEATAAREAVAAAESAVETAEAVLATAEADRRVEVERLAEEARRAEAARVAEERRRAEQARLAEHARIAEAARLAAEEALAEATRRAEAARAAAEEAAAAVQALDEAGTAELLADPAPLPATIEPLEAPRLAALEALLGPAPAEPPTPAAESRAASAPAPAPPPASAPGTEAAAAPADGSRKVRGRTGAVAARPPARPEPEGARPEPQGPPGADPDLDIRAVTMAAGATIRRVLGGDLAALEHVGAAVGGGPADQARRAERLAELMETLLVRALDATALALPMDHPFWSLFSGQQARDVMAALAILGHRFDGLGGWEDGRVPGQRELSIAIAHAGLDPMRVRRYPSGPEAEALLRDAHVLGGEWLAGVAPRLTVRELRLVLGREADAFADLWAEWDAIRPLLLAPA